MTLTFTVAGVPIPQGSMKAFVVHSHGKARANVTSDNDLLHDWRLLVGYAAKRARHEQGAVGPLLVDAVQLTAVFVLPRPERRSKTRPSAHISKPDLDKLVRAVCDALTGIVWKDDSQVDHLSVRKRYAGPGQRPHATILVQG